MLPCQTVCCPEPLRVRLFLSLSLFLLAATTLYTSKKKTFFRAKKNLNLKKTISVYLHTRLRAQRVMRRQRGRRSEAVRGGARCAAPTARDAPPARAPCRQREMPRQRGRRAARCDASEGAAPTARDATERGRRAEAARGCGGETAVSSSSGSV